MAFESARRLKRRIPPLFRLKFECHFLLEHFLGARAFEKYFGAARLKLQEQMLAHLEGCELGRTVPVPELRDASPEEFFTNFACRGLPVVFKGAASRWQACQKWNFEFLKDHYGSDPAILVNHKIYGETEEEDESYEVVTLAKLIDEMDAGSMKYARFHPLLDRHPELQQDLDKAFLDARMYRKTLESLTFHVLFMGGQGTTTPIHNAGNDNIFLQIEGQKKWHLWLPDVRYAFHPEANRGPAKSCDLDPRSPDLTRWPLYRWVDTFEVTLDPGDMLYVPAYVWHHVENLSHTIGIGTRWTAVRNTFGNDPVLAMMEFFNTRPSFLKTMFLKGEFDFNKLLIASMGKESPNDQKVRESATNPK